MNIATYRPGLGLIGTGLILWIIGVLLPSVLPMTGSVGPVLVMAGQVIFWVGVIVLVELIIKGLL